MTLHGVQKVPAVDLPPLVIRGDGTAAAPRSTAKVMMRARPNRDGGITGPAWSSSTIVTWRAIVSAQCCLLTCFAACIIYKLTRIISVDNKGCRSESAELKIGLG